MKAIVSTILQLPGLSLQRVAIYSDNLGGYQVIETQGTNDKPLAYQGTNYRQAVRTYSAIVDRMLGADL